MTLNPGRLEDLRTFYSGKPAVSWVFYRFTRFRIHAGRPVGRMCARNCAASDER
jgi:hypothetical protein